MSEIKSADLRADPEPTLRSDLQIIADMIEPGSRVLDVGCGDGTLLYYLANRKSVDARGMELGQDGVNSCVARGLSVVQGDADKDLVDYPDNSFDTVILSQTLQENVQPHEVIRQMLRIGKNAIVSFPNFAHWRVRFQLLFLGKMPVTGALRNPWYETPNIHLCTIRDFYALCETLDVSVTKALTLDKQGRRSRFSGIPWLRNFLGSHAVFLLTK